MRPVRLIVLALPLALAATPATAATEVGMWMPIDIGTRLRPERLP